MNRKVVTVLYVAIAGVLAGSVILLQGNWKTAIRSHSTMSDSGEKREILTIGKLTLTESPGTKIQTNRISKDSPSVSTRTGSWAENAHAQSYMVQEYQMDRFLANKHRNLTPQERESIYTYLLLVDRAEPERSFRNVTRNDLMELLCWQSPPPDELVNKLLEVYRDSRIAYVTRDYAVQHLAFFYEKTKNEKDQESICQALWQAVENDESSISGTALIGLYHIQKYSHRGDNERLQKAALRLATIKGVSPQAQLTAIRLCGYLEVNDIQPFLEEIVRSESNTILLAVARATIGDLGAGKTLPLE